MMTVDILAFVRNKFWQSLILKHFADQQFGTNCLGCKWCYRLLPGLSLGLSAPTKQPKQYLALLGSYKTLTLPALPPATPPPVKLCKFKPMGCSQR